MTAATLSFLAALALDVMVVPQAGAQPCVTSRNAGRTSSSQHWTNSDGRGSQTTVIRWKRGDCELRLDARGDFAVRPDLTGFRSVDDVVEIEERDGDHSRRLRITNVNRGLEYRWSIDGAEGFDVDRDKWLANMLLAVERRSAMVAKSRVPLLIQQGGPNAVLDETSQMDADWAKRQYFMALLSNASLSEANVDRILRQAADSMSSDYERAELVKAVAAKGPMSDRLARGVIAVGQRMSSDYEKRRALSAGIEAVTSPESRQAFFIAASTMSSSYELAELLIAAESRAFVDSVSSESYFKAVGRLTSDYERRRTLSALLKQKPSTPSILAGVLRASASINSDFELASLLVEFANVAQVRGELRELYLKATRSISSDYEYRRALTALLEQDKRI
ncbi:MAG TPA: hypothetical protein VFT29_14870 [Gemmatimonadaceae bacterium]|nr:hypothetical protein [Gemmatimonadaceae bacterium]